MRHYYIQLSCIPRNPRTVDGTTERNVKQRRAKSNLAIWAKSSERHLSVLTDINDKQL